MYIFLEMSCIMINMDRYSDINMGIASNRPLLIKHAKAILESNMSGVEIAKETGLHVTQVYAYRNGTRPIENAHFENLWKFEALYQVNNNTESEGKIH